MLIYRRKNIWKIFPKSIYKCKNLCYINNDMNNHGGNIMKEIKFGLKKVDRRFLPEDVKDVVRTFKVNEQVKGLER